MAKRKTETITLHFSLSHCPADKEFSLGVLEKRYLLTRHTAATLAEHSKTNRALALVAPEHHARITHFATEVEMPADALGIHLVTYPSKNPGSIPDLALPFVYIPIDAKRRHFRKRQKGAVAPRVPAGLRHFGVSAIPAQDLAAVRLHATQLVTPFQAAETIIFNHPDLLTLRQDVAAQVLYDHIDSALTQDDTLPQFISQNGPDTLTPYASTVVAINPQTGKPITPITEDSDGKPIVDRDGKPITWPQQNGQNVVQRYQLSIGVVGTTDGTQQGSSFSALAAVLRSVKDDLSLRGQSWSAQHGFTSSQRTNVTPNAAAHRLALKADTGPGFQWNVSNKTSMYGLDVDSGSLSYDQPNKTLSIQVKNWANRYLGAYVQFFDDTGAAINNPWDDGNEGKSKVYLDMLSAGNMLAGIPIWTDYKTLTFKMPDTATKADLLFGGMGIGDKDDDVDERGVIYTGLVNFGVPAFLVGLSVGTTGARYVLKNLEKSSITLVIIAVEVFLGAPKVILQALNNPKGLISTFGELAIGIIFSWRLAELAQGITGYTTATEILEKAPIVGWTFEVLSCSAGIADMTATTVEVLSSPCTYTLEVARTIDVQLTVAPDPTHGVKGHQDPIWPLESDHWEVVVQYKGGSSVKQTGKMGAIKPDTPLSVLFSGDTAISAAPGAQIQVSANFYSATNWLCGKWSSAWLAAVGTDGGTTLTLKGAIIEFLIPLTSDTQYSHYQKLAFQNGQHVWQRTTTPPAAVFSGSLDCPNTGNVLCRLVNITINDLAYTLAYTYQASGQGLPLDFGSGAQNGQMYAFQSISALGHPQADMKQPSIGFSLTPGIAYDQFGPAGLFSLPSATYQPGLDAADGKAVPADLVTAFANASGPGANSGAAATGSGSLVLPQGATVTVITATAEWYIGLPQQPPLYDMRRETDTIKVFRYPTPLFSPRNYYLDSRTREGEQKYHVRQVVLFDGNATFDYTPGQSWGAFAHTQLDGFAVHPNGYLVAVDTHYHKLMILKLPAGPVADADAPVALPMSGAGKREGLLKAPVALTITADGRILVLEQDNARIQAFDTMANPVPCFAGTLAFKLDTAFASELNRNALSKAFQTAYQLAVQPSLALLFSLPITASPSLDAGDLTSDLKQQFADNALALSDSGPFQIVPTQAGTAWMLFDEGAGLTYDIRKDLYVNQAGTELFTLPASLAADLDAGNASADLVQEFLDYGVVLSDDGRLQVTVVTAGSEWMLMDPGANQSYDIAVESNVYAYDGPSLLFPVPGGSLDDVTSGSPPPQPLVDLFKAHKVPLSDSLRIDVVVAGSSWQLVDQASSITYDIVSEPDIDVFHAATFNVEVIASDKEWILRDRVNTLAFHIKAGASSLEALEARQLISTMTLKDPVGADVHYLDIGVETKGFVYVLSYAGTGSAASDYHLDIYSPDGTWLSRTPKNAGDPGVNGAKFVVDQWRYVYTLNYESLLGPNNRTEPTVSTWIPSTPLG